MFDYVVGDTSPMGSATEMALIIAGCIIGIGVLLSIVEIVLRPQS